MRDGRDPDALRPLALDVGRHRWAEGSADLTWGDTHVRATVTLDPGLPPHLRGTKSRSGWLTAEYALLPRATETRRGRERLYAGGRSQEIQRLLGRALRAAWDLTAFPKTTLIVDVDVLQADGGTRCAGVVAGFAALHDLADRGVRDGRLSEWPLRHEVGAVSVGLLDGAMVTDLDYREDDAADLDLNVVATADGRLIEVQGGSERGPLDPERYVALVGRGVAAVPRVLDAIRPALAGGGVR
ncbi:MAG: ribonuclease PH [Trueperaceae bacterium]|nr:ribonuclease PH [Trueperaceae bacterium]